MLVTRPSIDKHDSVEPKEDAEFFQQQEALNKKITKISAHIERLNKSIDACKRGKAGRAKNRSLQIQKIEFQNLLNGLQKQLGKVNLMGEFFFVKEDPTTVKRESLLGKVRSYFFGGK